MQKKKLGFDTLLVHEGYEPDSQTNSCAVPIYSTTAYAFENTEHARSLFMLEQDGNIYSRMMNPTCDVLERRVAALEGGVGALATSSGHAAMVMTFFNLMSAGDELVSAKSIYGGAVNMMSKTLAQLGIKVNFVDSDDPESFRAATNEHTKAYFIETIANPMADVPDIAAIAAIAHENGIPLIADNTIATPYLLRPAEYGADIIIHSSTKFLCGNGSAMGGIVVDCGSFKWLGNPRFPEFNKPDPSYKGLNYAQALGERAFITKLRTHILRDIGACQSAFNAWVTLQGLETLSLRMKKHSENGLAVAKFLQAQPAVEQVYYPGLESSRYHALAQKQLPLGSSSVYCFDLKGGRDTATVFCDSLKLLKIVANLGDSRSMVSCPAVTTHSQLSDEQLAAVNIRPGTIRISLGLENIEDILEDIGQALKEVEKM